MKHPNEAELALYAGGDLDWVRQRLTERHVRNCGECQDIAADFSELRSQGSSFPNIPWPRLAAEMQANVRLGLAAGECVSRPPARSLLSGFRFSGQRLAVAGGVLGVLLVAGIWFQRPVSHPVPGRPALMGTVLEEAESGIQVREARQTLLIRNSSNRNVSYSVGGQGELRARSIDPETGNVTINHVYGE